MKYEIEYSNLENRTEEQMRQYINKKIANLILLEESREELC